MRTCKQVDRHGDRQRKTDIDRGSSLHQGLQSVTLRILQIKTYRVLQAGCTFRGQESARRGQHTSILDAGLWGQPPCRRLTPRMTPRMTCRRWWRRCGTRRCTASMPLHRKERSVPIMDPSRCVVRPLACRPHDRCRVAVGVRGGGSFQSLRCKWGARRPSLDERGAFPVRPAHASLPLGVPLSRSPYRAARTTAMHRTQAACLVWTTARATTTCLGSYQTPTR